MAEKTKTCWVALESNPDVMTKYIHNIGVPPGYVLSDVLGLDEELLRFVPKPCLAVILLFPYSRLKKIRKEEKLAAPDAAAKEELPVSENVWFMKQLVGNACGTVAVMHACANKAAAVGLEDGAMKKFMDETKGMTPLERGMHLLESRGMEEAHTEVASEGQTEAPEEDASIDHHFLTLVEVDGHLYELDGNMRDQPFNHGPTTPDTFLSDSAKIIQEEFMAKMPDESNFAVITLCAAPAEE